MNTHRVVITGVGLSSPIGDSLEAVSASLRENRGGVIRMEGWEKLNGLSTRLGAVCKTDLTVLPKKRTRTMGRVALLSTWATAKAIEDAHISQELLSNTR